MKKLYLILAILFFLSCNIAHSQQINYEQIKRGGNIYSTITGGSALNLGYGNGYVAVSGNYAYLLYYTSTTPKLYVVDITNPALPAVIDSSITLPTIPRNLCISGNYLYMVASTAHPANMNVLRIIDISDPYNPSIVGGTALTLSGNARSIQVRGKYAYVAYQNTAAESATNINIIDVSDPGLPVLAGGASFTTLRSVTYFAVDGVDGKYGYITNYSATNGQRFDVLDLSDPTAANPTVLGSLDISSVAGTGGEGHFIQIQGRYAYLSFITSGSSDTSSFRIIDISDPTTPTIINTTQISLPGQNGALSCFVAGKYLYVATKNDTTARAFHIIDVSNPVTPVLVGGSSTLSLPSGCVSSVIQGEYAYLAFDNATATSTFRIVRISGLEMPTIFASSGLLGELTVEKDITVTGSIYVRNGTIDGGTITSNINARKVTADTVIVNKDFITTDVTWTVRLNFSANYTNVPAMCTYDNLLFIGFGGATNFGDISSWNGRALTDYTFTGFEIVPSMAVYNGRLYAGFGSTDGDAAVYYYDTEDATPTWTVSKSDFPAGIETVRSLCQYNGCLYAGLGDADGDADLYSFDGTTWALNKDFGASYDKVLSLCIWNGKLYAGMGDDAGDADLFEYDGTTWTNIKDFGAAFEGVYSMTVYKGKLMVGLGNSLADSDIYSWDGTTWTVIYNGGNFTIYNMIAYNEKLYAAMYNAQILVWNGTTTDVDYDGNYNGIGSIAMLNGRLYAGEFTTTGSRLVQLNIRTESQLSKDTNLQVRPFEESQHFYTDKNTFADSIFTMNLSPYTTNTYNLGRSDIEYDTLYTQDIYNTSSMKSHNIFPITTATSDIGTSSILYDSLYIRNIYNTISAKTHNISPITTAISDIGTSSILYDSLYIRNIYNTLTAKTGDVSPITANVSDLGTSAIPYDSLYVQDIYSSGTLKVLGNSSVQNVIPQTTGTYDLGSTTMYFDSLFIDHIANYYTATLGNTMPFDATTNIGTASSPFDSIYVKNLYSTSTIKNNTYTAGSVLFVGTNKEITQDNSNLYWDDTNNHVGIGTTTTLGVGQIAFGIAGDDTIAIGRRTTDATNGRDLYLRAGSPKLASSTNNLNAGNLYLSSGTAEGSGVGYVYVYGIGGYGSGNTDRTPVQIAKFGGANLNVLFENAAIVSNPTLAKISTGVSSASAYSTSIAPTPTASEFLYAYNVRNTNGTWYNGLNMRLVANDIYTSARFGQASNGLNSNIFYWQLAPAGTGGSNTAQVMQLNPGGDLSINTTDTTGTLNVGGNIAVPTTNAYNLAASDKRFKYGYFDTLYTTRIWTDSLLSASPLYFVNADSVVAIRGRITARAGLNIASGTFSLGGTTVLPTGIELNYVDGCTSAIQTQFNGKLSLSGGTMTGTITSKDIVPDTTVTRDLGSSTVLFDSVYTKTLYSNLSDVNTDHSWLNRFAYKSSATVNGDYDCDAILYARLSASVDTNITDTGTKVGYLGQTLRNLGTGDNDGTLTNMMGIQISYGHFNTASITPITTNAYGLYVYPYYMTGTITNMYDIYTSEGSIGGTVTNRFSLYQASVTANNYLAGNTTQLRGNVHIEDVAFTSMTSPTIASGKGDLYVKGDFENAGSTSNIFQALTCANGDNNDVTTTSGRNYRIAGPTDVFTINGFTGGANGREIVIYNSVAQNLTLTNNGGATAANGILTMTGGDVTSTGVCSFILTYNATDSRWILTSWQP